MPGKVLFDQIRGDGRLKETIVFLATADAVVAEELRNQANLIFVKHITYDEPRIFAERF